MSGKDGAMQRVKYPLTPEAKETAKYFVDAWKRGLVGQEFSVAAVPRTDVALKRSIREVFPGFGVLSDEFRTPSIESIKELAIFQLIDVEVKFVDKSVTPNYHILLLQELRNAVENDFEVSDYFLTFNAVGTIITGDNVTFSGPFQSGASVFGAVTQNTTPAELVELLVEKLGRDILDANPELDRAIQDVESTPNSEQQSKLGKVISELGRCLEHVNNAKGVIEAIAFVAAFLRYAS